MNFAAASLCFLLSASLMLPPSSVFAAPPSPRPSSVPARAPEFVLPRQPTAPPALSVNKPSDAFICRRAYTHLGKSYSCDSHLGWDGENLRPILQDSPEALKELNEYQETRRRVRSLAYVGSVGLGIAALGLIGSRAYEGGTKIVVRNIGVFTGLSIAAGSFIYGYSTLQSNEEHLGRAMQLHNKAHPDHPIELQFSTGVSF